MGRLEGEAGGRRGREGTQIRRRRTLARLMADVCGSASLEEKGVEGHGREAGWKHELSGCSTMDEHSKI